MSGLGGFKLPATQKRQTLHSSATIASADEARQMHFDIVKADLVAALADYLKQATGTDIALQVPTSYYTQVSQCREIWGGKYADPFVSSIMDMVVQGCVDFGSENLLKTEDPDSPMQSVLDHYCANVNSDMPTVTKGLDAARSAFHRNRFLTGGVVAAWSDPAVGSFTTRDGIQYKGPLQLAMYPRDKFKSAGSKSGKFGGMELKKRDDLQEYQEGNDANDPDSEIELDGFLAAGRYQVLDRGRDETYEHYPTPYLAAHGLIGICKRLRGHQLGDYHTNMRIIRALLLLTRGSDLWVQLTEEIPELRQFEALKDALVDKQGGHVNMLAGDYTLQAKWVIPDLQALLSADKYVQDNLERLAGLGVIRIEGQGQRVSYMYNPKPLLMEMYASMQADRRFVEGILFQILVDANPGIFNDAPMPNFRQRTPNLFLEQWEKEAIATMFERGVLSRGTYGEQVIGFGFDIKAEARRRQREKAEGYDEIFEAPVMFTQTVRENKGEDEEEIKPIATLEAARRVNLTKAYRDMCQQVGEAAKSDMDPEEKRRRIWSIVTASIAAMAYLLSERLREYYSQQFVGTTEHLDAFMPYIERQARRLEGFGEDLLNGKSGMTGLYALATALPGEVDALLNRSAGSHLHRLSLYESEPFRVARLSASAAKAMDEGMKYAVRHSAFEKTTCQECIDRHGEIVPISQVFAGTWEHPHGYCTLTFHGTMAAAQKEKEEMLSIDDINSLVGMIDDMEETIFAEITTA